jgi:para-aminobenzoate synthetase component 1
VLPLSLRPGLRLERLPSLDSTAPMDAAEHLRDLPGLAVLESARPGRNARWSYLTADPVAVLEAPADGPDPFTTARRVLGRLCDELVDAPDVPPVTGGLVGYLGYDLGRRFERLPSIAAAGRELPVLRLGLHDW